METMENIKIFLVLNVVVRVKFCDVVSNALIWHSLCSIWDIKPFFIFTVTFSVLFVSTAASDTLFLRNHPPSVFNYYLHFFSVNCETSPWSSWAVCNRNGQTCGYKYGVQTRSRDILQIPSSNGEKCPSTLESQRCRLKYRSCVGMLSFS